MIEFFFKKKKQETFQKYHIRVDKRHGILGFELLLVKNNTISKIFITNFNFNFNFS